MKSTWRQRFKYSSGECRKPVVPGVTFLPSSYVTAHFALAAWSFKFSLFFPLTAAIGNLHP
jgi:hypothetical protein